MKLLLAAPGQQQSCCHGPSGCMKQDNLIDYKQTKNYRYRFSSIAGTLFPFAIP